GAEQGVVGIPREKVLDLTKEGGFTIYDVPCFAFLDDPRSVEGVRARAAVERATGRPPQFFVAGEAVGTVRLPSGAVSKIERRNPVGPVPAGFASTIYWQE